MATIYQACIAEAAAYQHMCCRDAHAFERKIKRANAKKNRDLAERLQAMRPTYRLDHLVKERCDLHKISCICVIKAHHQGMVPAEGPKHPYSTALEVLLTRGLCDCRAAASERTSKHRAHIAGTPPLWMQ